MEKSEENIEKTVNENTSDVLELGDKIHIVGGRFDNSRGRIYYIDETRIRILPDGVSDRLVDLEMDDGYLREEYEIENLFLVSKRKSSSFVVQQDYRVGQMAEAFSGLDGNLVGKYIIDEVNEKQDYIVLRDQNNDTIRIDFSGRGISLDTGIDVLRSRELPKKPLEEDLEEQTSEAEKVEEEEDILFEGEETVEIPVLGEIREIESALRNYPDDVQRSDMLQDFITKLDLASQKNPKKIREIRKLTELCLLLRNEIVSYSKNGVPNGEKSTSYDTLQGLARSDSNKLSKPVLDVKRVVYLDNSAVPENDKKNVEVRFLHQQIQRDIEFSSVNFAGNQSVTKPDFLPNWYIGCDRFNKENFVSWMANGKEDMIRFYNDREFFRTPILDVDGLPKVDYPIEGRGAITISADFLDTISFSVLRGLKGKYGRLKEKEDIRLIESPEEAPVDSYVLFPKLYEREVGSTRSGRLANDIGISMKQIHLLKDILDQGLATVPSSGNLFVISNKQNAIGNIIIEDLLLNIPLIIHGLGDAQVELKSYGFDQKELSYNQQTVIIKKIEETIAHIKNHIEYIREKSKKEIETVVFQNKSFLLEDRYNIFIDLINSEPILQELASNIGKRIPFYKENDIALFAGLYTYDQNLLYATLAGYPDGLARFRNIHVNKQFLESLHEALKIRQKNLDLQYEPDENSCEHVRALVIIKKIKDDVSQQQLLSKFLTQFMSYKKDNFIHCVLCDKHCLCEHEYLLLQEYLHPREKETIHKELLIRFSGGVFQGKFICNNCGQPISELDFDTSLEYDDSGAPLMGRSELIDKDAIANDEIDQTLGVQIGSINEIQLDSPEKTLYYQKAKEIFDRVGINSNLNSYLRIVNGVDAIRLSKATREQYIAMDQARIKKLKEQGQKAQKGLDYDVYINRIIISAVICYCILEVQTHIPNYVPRFIQAGCTADFRGFPLGDSSDKRIMTYFCCIASGIIQGRSYRGDDKYINDPWRLTEFGEERSEKKRQELLLRYIESVFKDILTYSEVQNLLITKKEYILKTYGKSELTEGLVETIPDNFTPPQYKSLEETIVPDAANEIEKIRGFIFESHKIASESVKKELNPFSERTCCIQPINKPSEFWKEKSKIIVPPKDVPRGPHRSFTSFTFNLRKQQKLEFNVSKNQYYKLFLNVCYEGIRIGLPHEPGYSGLCSYCGFKLPEDIDTDGESSLKSQNIEINDTTFRNLLNAVHVANSVETVQKTKVDVGNDVFQELFDIDPMPYDDWRIHINKTVTELSKLKSDSSEEQIAYAYSEISSYAIQSMEELKSYMTKTKNYSQEQMQKIIDDLLSQPIKQVLETIQSSLILPLKRIVSGYNLNNLKVPKSYDLDGLIIVDIETFLLNHTEFLKFHTEKAVGFAKSKLEYAIVQLSAFVNVLKKKVRAPLILGGSLGIPYILKAGIASILRDMMDTNKANPISIVENNSLDVSSRVPIIIFNSLIEKYRAERFKLTDEEIRIEIAKRDEKERMLIISKFDRLTKEEKAVELLKKKLGIGDWAVGGTKAIYAYNPEQYERDREQRAEMGFIDNSLQMAMAENNFYESNASYDRTQTNEEDF